MALRFIDSFDHYATADLSLKYNTVTSFWTIGSGGRTDNCLKSTQTGSNAIYLSKVLTSQPTWIVGFAFKPTSTTILSQILQFRDGSSQQCCVRTVSGGGLQFYRGTTALGSAVTGLSNNNWNYVEVKVTISSSVSANSCVIRVNSSSSAALSAGTSTKQTGNATADTIIIGETLEIANSNGIQCSYDDLYICDGTGTSNNNFLGGVVVGVKAVNATATYTDFSVTGASGAASAVNEAAPDGDTSYISASGTGDRESFNFGNLTLAPDTVAGIQLVADSALVGGGYRNINTFVRSGITNYDQTAARTSSAYNCYTFPLDTNPATGLAWTQSDLGSLEAGVTLP